MKKITLLLLGLLSGITCIKAQKPDNIPIDEAHFPDAVFRQYVADNFDKDFNNILSESERSNVQSIGFSYNESVSRLDGITYFKNLKSFEFSYQHDLLVPLDLRSFSMLESILTDNSSIKQLLISGLSNLQTLSCSKNKLTELDLSGCPNLERLSCDDNELSVFDLSDCANPHTLNCSKNKLTKLDLSGCSNLEELYCYDNKLSVLDLSDCANLHTLNCSNNRLTSLDVSHTKLVEEVGIRNNFALVTVDEHRSYDLNDLPGFDISKASNWTGGTLNGSTLTFIKDTVYYNYDISHPTQLQYARLALILSTDPIIPIDEAHFSDASFREYIANTIDLNQDGFLSAAEREEVVKIKIETSYNSHYGFINGLHYFHNLMSISIGHIDSIDLKDCNALTNLSILNGYMNYSNNTYDKLPLHISSLIDCAQLDTLRITGDLPNTDLQLPTSLTVLDLAVPSANFNELPTSLTYLSIHSASLKNFDFDLPNVKSLSINAPITNFNISSATKIQHIALSTTHLTNLKIDELHELKDLRLHGHISVGSMPPYYTIDTILKRIQINNCHKLTSIEHADSYTVLESIDLSGCDSLQNLHSGFYSSLSAPSLTDINLTGCKSLSRIVLQSDKLNKPDLTDCAALTQFDIQAPLTELHWPEPFNLETIKLSNTQLTSLDLSNQTSLSRFEIHNDSVIQSIDLSQCPNLEYVSCGSSFPHLFGVDDYGSIYVDRVHLITTYTIYDICGPMPPLNPNNDFTQLVPPTPCPTLEILNLSKCTALQYLSCHHTSLKNLDLTGLTNLTELQCSHNQLERIILSELYNLLGIDCSYNKLSSLDFSDSWSLAVVFASHNHLTHLKLANPLFPDMLHNDTHIEIIMRCSPDDPGVGMGFGNISWADNNFHPVQLNAQHAFNLNLLPGFDISKMRRLEGGVLNGKMLTFLQDTVRYEYRCADNGASAFFALVRDPSSAPGDLPISAENFPDARFRAYIQTHLDTDGNDSLSDEECLAVTEIDVAGQQIRTLQGLHHFVYLKYLNADGNLLTSLDLSRNAALEVLSCDDNYLAVETDAAFSFDLASLPDFDLSRLRFVRGGTLNGSRLTFLRDTVRFEYQTYYAGAALVPQSVPFHLVTDLPDVPEFGGLPISEENFPDEAFRQYVAAQFDRNANDSLSERERAAVSEINVAGLGIGSLQGLEHFPYLEKLDCSRNHLTALDLSGNNALQTLYCYENSLFVELDNQDGFDLRSLPDFEPERAENWKGGVVSGDTLRFIAKEVSYAYRHRLAGGTGVPETVSFTLTSDKQPDEPTANEDAEAAAALFRVHPSPFRHTLHIETALDLKRVSLYNIQGRLCRRYSSGFDALPADGLEPGLYLLLLETADGSTYRIKAVKE